MKTFYFLFCSLLSALSIQVSTSLKVIYRLASIICNLSTSYCDTITFFYKFKDFYVILIFRSDITEETKSKSLYLLSDYKLYSDIDERSNPYSAREAAFMI